MINGIVKKIMLTGLNKYSKIYGTTVDKVQIKVSIDPEAGNVVYTMCNDFKEVENVRFIDIMDKKIDILGYESLATPVLGNCLVNFSNEPNVNCSPIEVCAYILEHKSMIVLSYYKGLKPIKNITLKQQLDSIDFYTAMK